MHLRAQSADRVLDLGAGLPPPASARCEARRARASSRCAGRRSPVSSRCGAHRTPAPVVHASPAWAARCPSASSMPGPGSPDPPRPHCRGRRAARCRFLASPSPTSLTSPCPSQATTLPPDATIDLQTSGESTGERDPPLRRINRIPPRCRIGPDAAGTGAPSVTDDAFPAARRRRRSSSRRRRRYRAETPPRACRAPSGRGPINTHRHL